jgi:hypothetical protein
VICSGQPLIGSPSTARLPPWWSEVQGLLADIGWGEPVSLLGLGACAYTSVNSLGWALARADRRRYSAPMFVGAVGGGRVGRGPSGRLIQRASRPGSATRRSSVASADAGPARSWVLRQADQFGLAE